jgi:hypothetical protein
LWTLINKEICIATIKDNKILIFRIIILDSPKEIFHARIIITTNQTPIQLGLKELKQTIRRRRRSVGTNPDTENKIIIITIIIYKLIKKLQGSVPVVSYHKVKYLVKAIIVV